MLRNEKGNENKKNIPSKKEQSKPQGKQTDITSYLNKVSPAQSTNQVQGSASTAPHRGRGTNRILENISQTFSPNKKKRMQGDESDTEDEVNKNNGILPDININNNISDNAINETLEGNINWDEIDRIEALYNSQTNNNQSRQSPPPPQQAETNNLEKQLHEIYNIKTDNTIISLEDCPYISEDEYTSDIDNGDEGIKQYSPSVNPYPHKYGQFGRIKYTSYPVSDLSEVNMPNFPKIDEIYESDNIAKKIPNLKPANSELHSTKAQIIYTLEKNGETKMRVYDIIPNGIARGEPWGESHKNTNITNPNYPKVSTNKLRFHSEPAILRPTLRLNAKKIKKWKDKGYTNIKTKIRLFNSKNAPCDYTYDSGRRSYNTEYKDDNVYCDTLCQKITQEYPDTSIDVYYPNNTGEIIQYPKRKSDK